MKNIIVIGGSKGIGKEIVNSQLEKGNKCYNFSRTDSGINNTNLIEERIDILSDDLPDIENVDSIIYCPGSINLKPILQLKEEDFINDFNINVLGAIKTVKNYLNNLKRGNDPTLLFFSTVAVGQGMPFHSSVSVAKAGIEGLTKSLAAELAPTIRVNCIAPTITRTDMAQRILRNEKIEENIANKHPLKKICEAKDISDMADFLISRNAKSITGQIMHVDGGMSTLKI
jgi:NAD(P)-dependent dehydrogenase (short-subunit alcohol dehydrogenase family)